VVMEFVDVHLGDNIIQLQQYNMNTFVVVKQLENGYIIMAPDGETGYVTEEIFQKLKSESKIQ